MIITLIVKFIKCHIIIASALITLAHFLEAPSRQESLLLRLIDKEHNDVMPVLRERIAHTVAKLIGEAHPDLDWEPEGSHDEAGPVILREEEGLDQTFRVVEPN